MPLRRIQARLQVPQRLRVMVQPEEGEELDENSTCRFCWMGVDEDEGGELLAPCRCAGSVKYVHRRCLGSWQRTQRTQGAFRKSYRCDICKERYRVPRAPFSGPSVPLGGRLPTVDETKELLFSLLGSPIWQVCIDVWKAIVLANGLIQASTYGVVGLDKGFWLAWRSATFYYDSMVKYGPEMLVAAAAFPIAQLPTLLLTVGGAALVGLEMIGAVVVGWYAGALYGFARGSMEILRATVNLTTDATGRGMGSILAGIGIGAKGFLGILTNVCKGAACMVR